MNRLVSLVHLWFSSYINLDSEYLREVGFRHHFRAVATYLQHWRINWSLRRWLIAGSGTDDFVTVVTCCSNVSEFILLLVGHC